MEEIGCLVPVDPHTAKIVAKQVVKRVARKEAQTVWNPVSVVGRVVVILFGLLTEVPNSISSLLVSARPDAESNAVESVCRILLQDKGVVDTVWLAGPGADLDVVRETGLENKVSSWTRRWLVFD